MAEHDNDKTFLQEYGKKKFGEKLKNLNNPLEGGFNMFPEGPPPPTLDYFPRKEDFRMEVIEGREAAPTLFNQVAGDIEVTQSEVDRLKKMQELNGTSFDNGDRSQGDQEAEQRMVQNKKTGLLQKFVNMVTSPFSSALEKEFGTEDQPKFNGKDGVMYNGQFVHPDFYELIMNRPDLKQRFDETGSIYGD